MDYQNNYQPQYSEPVGTEQPMKWFKFLIYFALFASCVLYVYNGITALTGSHYDGMKDLVYRYFPGLKTADTLYGILCLALAAFAIYVRFQLAAFKANSPKLLNALYICGILAAVIYVIAVQIGTDGQIPLDDAISNITADAVVAIVMVGVNTVYFKKRQHMFVN